MNPAAHQKRQARLHLVVEPSHRPTYCHRCGCLVEGSGCRVCDDKRAEFLAAAVWAVIFTAGALFWAAVVIGTAVFR